MMKVWRGLFAFAAIYNLIVGGVMLAAPERVAAAFDVSGAGGGFMIAMCGILIAVFGVGYAIVSAALAKNRGIVWIGMIGKFAVVLLAASRFAAAGGALPLDQVALPFGDLVFVAAFALFLWRGPR